MNKVDTFLPLKTFQIAAKALQMIHLDFFLMHDMNTESFFNLLDENNYTRDVKLATDDTYVLGLVYQF